MATDDGSEASLELTLLSADNDILSKPKTSPNFIISRSFSSSSFAVAWIDPSLKKSTKTLRKHSLLHFSLPPSVLDNPRSTLTIQILSTRLPFGGAKLVGTTTLPLSSVRLGGGVEVWTLQLHKPSGRACGTVRLAARILGRLGEIPVVSSRAEINFPYIVNPSAPPWPEECIDCEDVVSVDSAVPRTEDVSAGGDYDCGSTDSRELRCAPPLLEECISCEDVVSIDSAVPMTEGEGEGEGEGGDCDCRSTDLRELRMKDENGGFDNIFNEQIGPRNLKDNGSGNGAWRSFLVGLASGTIAVVLVGAAGFSEG